MASTSDTSFDAWLMKISAITHPPSFSAVPVSSTSSDRERFASSPRPRTEFEYSKVGYNSRCCLLRSALLGHLNLSENPFTDPRRVISFSWPNKWFALNLCQSFDSEQPPPSRVVSFCALFALGNEIVPNQCLHALVQALEACGIVAESVMLSPSMHDTCHLPKRS
jgi:hypothetical protein